MQDLHLIGVQEDGEHLLLGDDSGGEFRLRLDDALRAAARTPGRMGGLEPGAGGALVGGPSERGSGDAPAPAAQETLTPRAVQAMIRAGASPAEAAQRANWTVEKVHKYDGPILAERAHIAATGGAVRLRGRYGEPGTTLAERVAERLAARGVPAHDVVWDAHRAEDGPWTVVVRFAAGGRGREATWRYSRQSGTMHALDDEALWLSAEDDAQSAVRRPAASRARDARPSPTRHGRAGTAPEPAQERAQELAGAAIPTDGPTGGDEGVPAGPRDLMDSVRQRSSASRRRGGTGRRVAAVDVAVAAGGGSRPTDLPPLPDPAGEEALPLADLRYDPETMPPPPGAHSDPRPDGADGRPEPAAVAARPARGSRRTGTPAAPRDARVDGEAPQGEAPASAEGERDSAQEERSGGAPAEPTSPGGARSGGAATSEAAGMAARARRRRTNRRATAAASHPGDAAGIGTTPTAEQDHGGGAGAAADSDERADAAVAAGDEDAAVAAGDEDAGPQRPSVESETVREPQLPWGEAAAAPVQVRDSDPGAAQVAGGAGEGSSARRSEANPSAAGTSAEGTAFMAPRTRKATTRAKGRTGVPSWDDIMFGSRGKE